jgi:hypothetical protein
MASRIALSGITMGVTISELWVVSGRAGTLSSVGGRLKERGASNPIVQSVPAATMVSAAIDDIHQRNFISVHPN